MTAFETDVVPAVPGSPGAKRTHREELGLKGQNMGSEVKAGIESSTDNCKPGRCSEVYFLSL